MFMKKFYFLIFLLFGTITIAGAQNRVHYQGEVSLGYGIGTGTYNIDRVPINTVHGARICQYLFVGGGTGVDIYTEDGNSEVFVPLFASAKAYLPINKSFSLLGMLNLGYGVFASSADEDNIDGGFYAYPQVGCSLKLSPKKRQAFDFTLGYHSQSLSKKGVSANFGSFAFKVAFVW